MSPVHVIQWQSAILQRRLIVIRTRLISEWELLPDQLLCEMS